MKFRTFAIPAVIAVFTMSLFGADTLSDRRAPGFSLYDSKFIQHDPQDYRGKVVLVDFMLTTCPVCNQVADTLVKVKAKYGDKIALMSIMTGPDNFQSADQFAQIHKINWPMLMDSGQVMMSYLKLTPNNPTVHFPHLFIIDGSGMIRHDSDANDAGSMTFEALCDQIDKLIGKPL